MTATIATSGMMKPPRSSLALLVGAPLRAATESGAADVAVCARTGVLAMETARAAATDAFLKLILNSLLSCSGLAVPQWYIVDNPKSCRIFRAIAVVLPICTDRASPGEISRKLRLRLMTADGYYYLSGAGGNACPRERF